MVPSKITDLIRFGSSYYEHHRIQSVLGENHILVPSKSQHPLSCLRRPSGAFLKSNRRVSKAQKLIHGDQPSEGIMRHQTTPQTPQMYRSNSTVDIAYIDRCGSDHSMALCRSQSWGDVGVYRIDRMGKLMMLDNEFVLLSSFLRWARGLRRY